jgi:hypothetical protein
MNPSNERRESPDALRIDSRADLLPEEQTAGSDDPHAQAEAILTESDERTDDPEGTQRESTQTPDSTTGGGAQPPRPV